ncbi:MAG: alpha/beta fold hydrolase [Burkholderiaceae bacterium]
MSIYRFPDYQVAGDADTTVFLLHGAYGSKHYYEHQIGVLVGAGYRVVAWDAPGYGISPLPADYRIESLADTCAALIERTGTRRNVLFGHSMGGIIAPRTAVLLPQKIHALIVSATLGSFTRKSPEDRRIFLQERLAPLDRGLTLADAAMPVIRSMFAPGSKGPLVDRVIEVAAATPLQTFRAAITAIVNYDGDAALSQVAVPTLLIAGEHDKVGRPDGMRETAKAIRGAEFVCVPDSAHYAWAEQPELFNRHLLSFIERALTARTNA